MSVKRSPPSKSISGSELSCGSVPNLSSCSDYVYFGAIIVGAGFGWTSPLLSKLKVIDQTPLPDVINAEEASWVASSCFIGAIIGPQTITFLSNFAGRKPCLLLGGFITGLAYLILALANNLAMLYIGRALSGLGHGIVYVIQLVYIGEIASTPIRGIFLSMLGFSLNIGLLLIYSVGPCLSYAAMSYITLAMSLAYTCGVLFIPETPLFLVFKGQEKKAKKVLEFLGREDNFHTIISSKEEIDSKAKWTEIVTIKSNRKALLIVITLHILQQLSGSSVLFAFVTTIFELVNSSISPYISTILVSVTQIIAGLIAPFFVEKFGRRPLLLCSTAICSLSMGLLGTYFYLDQIKSPVVVSLDWLPLVSLIIFSMSYALGFGFIPATFIGEMFTPRVRSAGATATTTIGWLWAFAMASAFGYLLQLGNHIAFYVFTIACAVAFVFTLFLVPETKGKSLVKVQEMLSL